MFQSTRFATLHQLRNSTRETDVRYRGDEHLWYRISRVRDYYRVSCVCVRLAMENIKILLLVRFCMVKPSLF